MNLEIRPSTLGGSTLVREYLAGTPAARAFFTAGDPFQIHTYRNHLHSLRARFSPADRERAASSLVPCSPAAERRLDRWVTEGGAVVTTGQQAGLFTGPLFTLYKALSAVRLARSLEASLGELVLPVFWVASEDHDWAEVDHTFVVGPQDRLIRLEAHSREPSTRPLPITERTLAASIETTVDNLVQMLSSQAFDARYMSWLRDSYVEGAPVAGAFGEVVRRVLEPFDAYVVDAAGAGVKSGSVAVLERAVVEWEEEAERLRRTSQELEAAGYASPVPILAGSPNAFVRTAHGRERLVRDRRGWVGRESGTRMEAGAVARMSRDEPSQVSPNVLLRPVVESAAFPVLAYVAGPGEMAYWGQLGGLFAHHGVPMPPVHPRASFLLVEGRVRRGLEASEVALEALSRPIHELIEERARSRLAPEIRAALTKLRRSLVERFDAVVPELGSLDPTLTGAVGTTRNRALREVARLERKVVRAQKRSEEEWARRIERVAVNLRPLGEPQERVHNGIPYLVRHGEALLHELLARIPELVERPGVGVEEVPGPARAG